MPAASRDTMAATRSSRLGMTSCPGVAWASCVELGVSGTLPGAGLPDPAVSSGSLGDWGSPGCNGWMPSGSGRAGVGAGGASGAGGFGRSLRRFFLRSPLKFDPRITSRYSSSRFHPVLQRPRAHRGVDYGAPTGAPVIAVATGTVVSATSDSVNGRMVRIRHGSGYDSYYLHLSAFAQGVRRGARVDQGQTIGLVGSTGLATGPHLHYGLQKNGAWVDPLREHRNMPPGDPVPAAAMEAFRVVSEPALAALESAMGSSLSP